MLIVAFDESTISRRQVQMWYTRLKEGREDVNDDACASRLSTSTTDENIEALKKTLREVADDVGISFGLCQAIFTDVLSMNVRQRRLFQNC